MANTVAYSPLECDAAMARSRPSVPNGKELVALGTSDNGGVINVVNKTGETVVQMYADEYGNGLVGAYNRKGRGRTLQPGP